MSFKLSFRNLAAIIAVIIPLTFLIIYLSRLQEITGRCYNSKEGALVESAKGPVWILGKNEWEPDKIGKSAKIFGAVSQIDDRPVFLIVPGEPQRTGIPCTSLEEMEQKKWRKVVRAFSVTVSVAQP